MITGSQSCSPAGTLPSTIEPNTNIGDLHVATQSGWYFLNRSVSLSSFRSESLYHRHAPEQAPLLFLRQCMSMQLFCGYVSINLSCLAQADLDLSNLTQRSLSLAGSCEWKPDSMGLHSTNLLRCHMALKQAVSILKAERGVQLQQGETCLSMRK